MSDISIPGISGSNDRIDTERVIEDLVRVERIPLDRLEQEGEDYRRDRFIWQDIGRSIGQLQERSRSLFSFDNPFRDRIAASSQEAAITAIASRQASEQQSDIEVQRLAGRDRFLSAKLAPDYQVAPGSYRFRVGEQEAGFEFAGGTLREFAEQANRELGDLLSVKIVQSDADNLVAVFEAELTGVHNRLQFLDAARRLALDTGVIAERSRDIHIFAPAESAAYPDVAVVDGEVTLPPGTEILLPLPRRLEPNGLSATETVPSETPSGAVTTSDAALALEADIRVLHNPPDDRLPPNPITPSSGEITRADVTIFNIPSETILPEYQPPVEINDLQFLFVLDGQQRSALPALTDSGEFRMQQFPLQDQAVDALYIRNRNTHRELSLRDIRIVDANARAEGEPLHPLDRASDAELTVDGVAVTRPSNTIDDLLPGVTLQLQEPTSGPAVISVAPDWDTIQGSVIAFLGDYNQLVRDINILTRNDEQIVEEIAFFDEAERDRARERLGLFAGNITLNQLRQRLQRITQNAILLVAGGRLDCWRRSAFPRMPPGLIVAL